MANVKFIRGMAKKTKRIFFDDAQKGKGDKKRRMALRVKEKKGIKGMK